MLKRVKTYPPPPPPLSLPELRRVALDLYRVRPPVLRKLPDLGIATRVSMSPLVSPERKPVLEHATAAATTAGGTALLIS